ncbi:hypothetical protein C8J57DRAFT_1073040 [Mycena rebaudengoi]|nr:hypothetical protein C8J57DRAFT_1104943 [Mycena rebaudengoi]KAJ7259890.1 hypothetical protein C8J57DRAFT_1073040 [Mycena rebaudengoi]
MLIVDADGFIIAILLGRPEDPDWDEVMADAVEVLRSVREDGLRWGVFKEEDFDHRRGDGFLPLSFGTSLGGGQRRPGMLAHSRRVRRLIRRIRRSKSLRRVFGFHSCGLATFEPKLYQYLVETLGPIYEQDPSLELNFTNSVFPAATVNCGPHAATFEHSDFLNLINGLCGISCGGKFDAKKSALFYMRQLKLVIEFPSASSILIPSSPISHGNTPLQPGETRYSMTQYAAAALFRWSAYGYQTAKSLLSQPGGEELRNRYDGVPGSRWEWALNLFSKYDELEADHLKVFGTK